MEDKRNLLEDQIEAHLKKMKTLDPGSSETVSYTHLTLPTILRV